MPLSIGNSKFSSDAILLLDPSDPKNHLIYEVEVLVVAGGGGGGRYGAGGGGGGVVHVQRYKVTPGGSYNVTVGGGGAGHAGDAQQGGRAADGQDSIFDTITAIGGGGGGNYNQSGTIGNNYGSPGGSGGGSGSNGNDTGTQPSNGQSPGGSGVPGQGHPGGSQSTGYATGGGGGGGAGGPGGNGKTGGISGEGGPGKLYHTAGTPNYYGGGGGGGALNGFNADVQVTGGKGGGGQGIAPSTTLTYIADGQDNLGGGGGGGSDNTIKSVARAGDGGNGVVIVRYPGQQKAAGGHIFFQDGYTIHVFGGGGTFQPYSSYPSNASALVGLTDLSGSGNSVVGRSFQTNRFLQPGNTPAGGASGNNTVTFATQGTGTFTRLGHGQTIGGYKVRPEDAIYYYELGVAGCHYHGNSASIGEGNYVRWTVDYYISPDAQYYPYVNYLGNLENYGNGALSGGFSAPNSLTGVWQTVEVEYGPRTTVGNGTQAMFLYPGGCGTGRLAERGYVLYRNPRCEFYASHTRPTYDSTYQSLNFDGSAGYFARGNFPFPEDDFTISMWFRTGATGDALLSYAATSQGGGNNEVLIFDTAPMSFYVRDSNASIGLTCNDNTWRYLSLVRSISGNVDVYVNGSYSTSINLSGGKIRQGGSLVIGGEQDSTGQGNWGGDLDSGQMYNGSIGGLEIYSRKLYSEEILNNYNAQKSRFGL